MAILALGRLRLRHDDVANFPGSFFPPVCIYMPLKHKRSEGTSRKGRLAKKSKLGPSEPLVETVPPDWACNQEELKLGNLSIDVLRTMCNNMSRSCRDSNGRYLPKQQLIRVILRESCTPPQLPSPRVPPRTPRTLVKPVEGGQNIYVQLF